jgi:hypothetical protein
MFAELSVSHELRKATGKEAGIILRSTVCANATYAAQAR